MTLINQDINKLPNDGYVVFPLSMSRLGNDQNPHKCMEYLSVLDTKIQVPSNDVVFLYTNGLYFNTDEAAYTVRSKTNQVMLSHRNALKKLINKKASTNGYILNAFHFLPFDYILLNSDEYQQFFQTLQSQLTKDTIFERLLKQTLQGRKYFKGNINFVLEEIVVSHIIREHLVELPKTLVHKDTFRLIAYPGSVFLPEVYIWQQNVLSHNKERKERGRYSNATYDLQHKELCRFDEIVVKVEN